MTRDRQLYISPNYLFSCLRDGAKHTKKGKGSIQSNVAATLQVADDRILVDRFVPEEPQPDPEQPVYIHVSSVRNPSTKGRNVRYRIAAAPGWSLSFTVQWDRTIVSRGEIESVANDAGALTGLGDGRSIGFGRFVVTSFAAQDA